MGIVSPGFRGRPRGSSPQLPPGQYLTNDFPVLSAGPTPRVPLDRWQFTISTESGEAHRWSWPELMELPADTPTVDIHCVTKWSKLGTTWQGVPLDMLMSDVGTAADYAMVQSYGGYTTNLPLEDLLDGQAWVAYKFDGEDLAPEHGGPARLTAEDGYSAQRSYSLAAPADGDRIELTVQRLPDGEVSPYLTEVLSVGDPVEIRGPVGGWFVWRPAATEPILLVAGGSGVVPLRAMIRARRQAGSRVPFRLIYSVRSPAEVFYTAELRQPPLGVDVSYVYTRQAPDGWPKPPGRISVADVNTGGWPPDFEPTCFVCGPTGFVEAVSDILVALGHDPGRVKTERFGPS